MIQRYKSDRNIALNETLQPGYTSHDNSLASIPSIRVKKKRKRFTTKLKKQKVDNLMQVYKLDKRNNSVPSLDLTTLPNITEAMTI